MRLKRNIPLTILGIFLFGVFGALGLPYMLFAQYETVPLEKLTWEREPSVLSFSHVTRGGKDGVLIIRLSDGKDHFFAGNIRSFRTLDGNIILAPKDIPETYKGSIPLNYIEHGRKIFQLSLAYHFGEITTITENPLRSYLAIEMSNGRSMQYCIIERITDTKKPSCQQIGVGVPARSLWNPEKDHEFLILTEENEIIVFDPWEKEPNRVRTDTDLELHAQLKKLFSAPPQREKRPTGYENSLSSFFSFVLDSANKKFNIYPIPPFSDVHWLSDNKHFLIQKGARLSIVEFEHKKKAEINLPSFEATLLY
ncbi:MAG: hypothetical protein Q8P56_00200 [Candidatus Uhrbacteria bacterium]|nr:hypothetical protein [Candidatus Uhrbacteria bacterium]